MGADQLHTHIHTHKLRPFLSLPNKHSARFSLIFFLSSCSFKDHLFPASWILENKKKRQKREKNGAGEKEKEKETGAR